MSGGRPSTSPGSLEDINRRNARRLLPVLVAGYVLNTLAKTNVGFAALEMNKDLNFTPAIFGLGAGLFFVTYTLFEVPSNLLMRRVGARRWLARILITWGLVAMAMAFTSGATSFYVLRLLLGLAEAGWYPGVIFYLSLWFPRAYRARATMLFYMGAPIAAVFGSPLSGALLALPMTIGLRGWQWLFIVEGLPSVLLGLLAIKLLRNTPDEAPWLSAAEKGRLKLALIGEQASVVAGSARGVSLGYVGRLALFSGVNFAGALGLYVTFFWLPRAVKSAGALNDLQTGFVTAAPFLFSALALAACAASSDRRRERKWHATLMFLVSALAMAAILVSPSPLVSLGLLTLAMSGAVGVQGTLFALFSEGLRGRDPRPGALAAGLATITTIGNLGGLIGSILTGKLLTANGGFGPVLVLISGAFFVAALLIALTRRAVLEPPQRPSVAFAASNVTSAPSFWRRLCGPIASTT